MDKSFAILSMSRFHLQCLFCDTLKEYKVSLTHHDIPEKL